MGSISDYLENEMLDHIFNGAGAAWTPPATVYIGLSTADPLDTGAGIAEPSGNNYGRIACAFGAAATRMISNSGTLTFPQASGPWGLITHFFICDHQTNTSWGTDVQLLAHGILAVSKSVVSGNTPSFAVGEIDVSFLTLAAKANGHNISDYLAIKILDRAFRNQAFAQPAIYVAYATANLADDTTGTTVTEVANSNGYARKLVNANGGASPTWDLAALGLVDNTHNVDSGPPTGSWGLCTAVFLVDSGTYDAGNVLFYDNNPTEQTPGDGDTVRIEAGAGDFSLT
jgi:hypothetical protein